MSELLPVSLLAWTFVTWSVATFAFLRTGRAATSRPAEPTCTSTILLRPCAGEEDGLVEALRSSGETPTHVAIRFLIARADDAAAAIVTQVSAELRRLGRDARLVVTGASAPNAKADQIARALAAEGERHEIVSVADSDVLMTGASFDELTRTITQQVADAAWAPPVEIRTTTFPARVSAAVLDSSLHSFVLLAGIDPRGMVGKAMAIRRDALDVVGGFGASVDRLGEDMDLAARLRRAGYRTTSVPSPAVSLAHHRTAFAVVRRYARWVSVIRNQRPALLASYPLLFAAAPLQLAASVGALVLSPSWLAVVAVGGVIAARMQTAAFARLRAGRPLTPRLTSIWFADLTLLAALVVAVCAREVRWRGRWLRLDQGRIFEVDR